MNKKNVIWWRYCFKTDIFDIHIEYNTYYKQSDMNMSKFINSFTKFINSFKWNHTSIWLENTVLFFPLFPYLGFRPISEYSRLDIILCNHPCVYCFFSLKSLLASSKLVHVKNQIWYKYFHLQSPYMPNCSVSC